jgi:serine O-acetyltransferase
VIVGAGAKVLGGFTVGDGARIGSNAVVVREVPPGATVVGIPGRIVEERAKSERFAAYAVVQEQDDPYAKAIQELVAHSHELERAVAALTEKLARLEKAEREQQLRVVK